MPRWLSVTVAAVLGLTSVGGWFFYSPMPAASPAAADSRTVMVGGRERSFLVVAPPAVQAGAPVLIVLHGSLMDGGKMRGMLGPRFERLARQHGAVVVYPSGIEGHFNDGRLVASYSARTLNIDDVGFMRAIVGALAASNAVDRTRVFAFGYSNGGAPRLGGIRSGGRHHRRQCQRPDTRQHGLDAGACSGGDQGRAARRHRRSD
ncbi:PHB depolymerase family esterase [Sphaerotilus sp.]|uniref:PHB depolymerase family esterase n=1 Tax=Sphaerotilus sp. TaxID=2093942 RepID=UPI00286E1368|nr:PHB depolymerase family esterase [Sphaerotilus sp.]